MVISNIIIPPWQVQIKGIYCHHSNGPHGCEVRSDDDNAPGSPLPLPLRVIPSVMLWTLTFYTRIVLFFCHTLSNYFVVSLWNKNCPFCWYVILFVWPRSRCAIFLVSGHLPNTLHFSYITTITFQQCLLHHISVKFH